MEPKYFAERFPILKMLHNPGGDDCILGGGGRSKLYWSINGDPYNGDPYNPYITGVYNPFVTQPTGVVPTYKP